MDRSVYSTQMTIGFHPKKTWHSAIPHP
ncbi:TPA: hypothetical protein ANIA_11403 [Aspergillus nidulans FGSC A4]|uniref:Uncharacterized protein n=1 Tax=Emericella nidulans (strain FGSC A4 / ATCC 38163 / CBS 112.46 / NRRL 194 / M139) TaxID=227321 RepID=C8V4Q9_EMENI|nr:TPA: hypothetical protein ANIA_11403 [Aspergillus nidulans FGSC A4]